MGKMSDLDLQIKELRSCGETIIEIANTLAGMFFSETAGDTPPKATPKGKPKAPRKLSDIDPSRYDELLKEADALGKPEAGTDG